jgi:serine/threonine-protein kinase
VSDRVTWGGRYAIYDELASGGMATIFLAARLGADPNIPPVVALKKLSEQFAKQPEFVAMFLDEAHLAARIRHPNVVATYEFLRTDDGLGIVMDLVVGASLMQLIRGAHSVPQPPAPLPVTLAIVTGALDGLQAAHEISDDSGRSLNLVHRDVSPHNIIVGADGVSRVIDFGIAKAAGRLQVTDVGVLKGKFAYMSPEQIRGATVDRRTDIYAAGIVLWESLAGRKLFQAKTNEELLTLRTSGKIIIPPPSSLNADVPPELDALVARALSTDPSQRFGSALAMAETLRADHEVASEERVATWVRSRAGERLALLDAKRRKLEELLESGASEPPPRNSLVSLGSSRSKPAPPLGTPSTRPIADIPELELPKPTEAPVSPRQSSPASRPRFGGDLVLDEGVGDAPVPLRVELDSNSLVAAMHAVSPARLSSPRVRPIVETRTTRPLRGGVLVLVFVLLGALGAAAAFELPVALKAEVLSAATRHGLSMQVDRVEVSRVGLALIGVKGGLVGCPSIRFSAAEVDVDLDRSGAARRATIPGFELSIVGPPVEVASQLGAWQKIERPPLAIVARSGHIVWSQPSIPTMVVEAVDAKLTVDATEGSGVALDSAGLLVNLPRGHAGPWTVHVERAGGLTRARLGLDPSVSDGPPSVTVIQRSGEGASVTVDIPRASTFKAGLPAGLFDVTSDLAVEVAGHGMLSASGDELAVEGQLGLYGLEVGSGHGATVPLDVVVSGSVRGDPAKPLALTSSKLTLGKATSPVSGTVTAKADGVRVEIDRPAPAAPNARGLVLDTRDWTAAVRGAAAPAAPR